jgi:hypothetical protein
MSRTFWMNLGWLIVLVATVGAALGLDAAGHLPYFTSLVLFFSTAPSAR